MSTIKILHDHPFVRMKVSDLFFEKWMSDLDRFYIEIPPRFNRSGWYFDRKTGETWIESIGRAWKSKENPRDVEQFQWELEQWNYEEKPLTQREFDALKLIFQETKLIDRNNFNRTCESFEIFQRRRKDRFHLLRFRRNLKRKAEELNKAK